MTPISNSGEYFQESFHGLQADELPISDSSFDECTFKNCMLAKQKFHGCTFNACSFIDCDLSQVDFSDTHLADVTFQSCKIVGVDWTSMKQKPVLPVLTFIESKLDFCSFFGVGVQELVLQKCSLKEVDFREAKLAKTVFDYSDLEGALFHATDLSKTSFKGAQNYDINFETCTLTGAQFSLPEALRLFALLKIEILPMEQV